MRTTGSLLSLALLCFWAAPSSAEYVLLLKNGRRIVVQSYRDEGQMITFFGVGGEISLSKDQIQAIRKAGAEEPDMLKLPGPANSSTSSRGKGAPEVTGGPQSSGDRTPSLEEEKAKDEAEYRTRLAEINRKLESARARYLNWMEHGGNANEGANAWVIELTSKLKDRRGAQSSEYIPKEKALSDLTSEIDQLQKEQETLIREIKNRSSDSSSR